MADAGNEDKGDGEEEEEAPVKELQILGPSEFIFPNGARYLGTYTEGEDGAQFHGQGTYVFNHATYAGTWECGKLIEGKFTANDHIYEGKFDEHFQFDVSGTYTWPDGRIYKGEMKGGKIYGRGKYLNFQRVNNTMAETKALRHRKLLAKKPHRKWTENEESMRQVVGKDIFCGLTEDNVFNSNEEVQAALEEKFAAAAVPADDEAAAEE